MIRRIAIGVPVLLVLLTGRLVSAQWGGYSYHASTAEEGIQRGFADVVRSQGMANLYNAQAATEAEKARSAYLDNQYKATQTYFEMRRYNTESRRSERASPLSTEQYVRLARVEAPSALTSTQLDPLTGAIAWPTVLAIPEYAAFRSQIEKLFADRSSSYGSYGDIQKACNAFLEQLKADIMKFPAGDYVSGRKFLDSLIFAARARRASFATAESVRVAELMGVPNAPVYFQKSHDFSYEISGQIRKTS